MSFSHQILEQLGNRSSKSKVIGDANHSLLQPNAKLRRTQLKRDRIQRLTRAPRAGITRSMSDHGKQLNGKG
jgi:3-deoxy-D-manno-octulosonic acid (KDO) 8-phosphate synthase